MAYSVYTMHAFFLSKEYNDLLNAMNTYIFNFYVEQIKIYMCMDSKECVFLAVSFLAEVVDVLVYISM